MTDKAPWITYRPELKVLDCTIRDGGLINNSQFSDDEVRAVYQACLAAGVDYMEIGYKNSPTQFPKSKYGPWRHCEEEDMRRIVGDHTFEATGLKLSAMADAGGKSDWKHQIIPAKDSVLDVIRVACYVHQISEAVDMLEHCHALGYETTLNIMAISVVADADIDQALEIGAKSPAGTIVVVDSYGNLFREQIDHLVRKYTKAVEGTGKYIGMHAHNNLQLAFANTVEAIILGANRVDATMLGLGRGAGNCQTELLIGFLHNPRYHLRPVLQCIQEHIEPLRKDLRWGFDIPYMITGLMNQHPRAAMAFQSGNDRGDLVKFFDSIVGPE